MQVNNNEYNVTTGRKRRRQVDWDDDLNTDSQDGSGSNASEIKKRNFAISEQAVVSSTTNYPLVSARFVNNAYGSWHHGALSRERAEALLSGSSDGVFLVRESVTFPGDLTLCVSFRGREIGTPNCYLQISDTKKSKVTRS